MKKYMLKTSILSIATAIVLATAGCSGGGGSSSAAATATTSADGAAAKGPFKEGSLVMAYQLDANGSRSSVDANTTTTDSRGHFGFGSKITWSGPTEFVISGEYLNENTGTYMVLAPANGLSAVTNIVSGTTETVNINILTNIATPRIKADMLAGASITQAKADAQESVAELFNLNLSDGVELTDLDLTDATENVEANTQLLVISAALLNTDNPEQVLEQLAEDMADGSVDSEAVAALDELKTEVATVDLQEVAAVMEDADIGVTDAPSAESALNGTLSFDHTMSFTAMQDAFQDTVYTSAEMAVNGIIGESGAISIVNGTYSIDGAAFVSTAGTVANGQKIRIKATSSADYSTNVEAKLTIGGGVIAYNVATQDDPRVDDTTPNDFSFGYLANQTKNTADITSSSVMITGINTATDISIDYGEFSLDAGSNWATSGTVNNDDNVTVRHTTSVDGGTQAVSTVTIGGKTGTFSTYTVVDDTTPDNFTFTSVNDVNQSATATVESNDIIISGINTATPISVVGGEYSLDSGTTYTSVAGSVNDGATIMLKATASTDYETTTTVSVTVGNVVSTFDVTTMSDPFVADTIPNAFAFTSVLNQATDTDVDANITVSGINTATPISITNGTYSVNGGGQDSNVSNGDVVVITNTTSTDFDTDNITTLTIGGVSATFKTRTLLEDTTPDSISFDSNETINVNTLATSNTVTITGINREIPISIVNGEYSLDGVTYTSVEGTVSVNDTVAIQQTSASTQGTSNVTTVTIGSMTRSFTTVTIKNPPIINGTPALTIAEDATYSFAPDTNSTSGEIASWSITGQPSWATFNTVNGLLSGTPTNDNVGTDTNIIITATNSEGNASLAAFDINVTNTNDAPTAQDTNVTINEDTAKTIGTAALVADIDIGDTYTLTATQPANGGVVIDATNLVYTPNANFFGSDSFTYTAKDEGNATVTATVNVTVVGVADVAVITGTFTTAILEDATAPVTATVTIEDGDPGENAAQENNVSATHGLFNVVENGTWTYTLTDSPTIQALADAETLTDSATGAVVSADGGTAADLNVTITGLNDTPTLAAANQTTASIKKQTDLTITVGAEDVDNGATLTLIAASATGATVSITDASVGVITFNATDSGAYTLNYTFSDENDANVTGSVSVTVTESDAPVAANDTSTTDEDIDAIIAVLSNDSDDFTADENLTITIESAPAHGSANIEADNTITYAPALNYNGTDSFTYKVTDVDGGFDTADVNITINAVNDAPVAVDDANTTAEDTNVTFNVVLNDGDVDGDDFNVTAVTQGANGSVTFTIDTVTYSPNADYNGTDSFTYTISDGTLEANATVDMTITSVNDSPEIATISDVVVDEDSGVAIVPFSVTDVDSTPVLSVTSSDTSVAIVDINETDISITPQANANGAVTITVSADDVDETFTFTVNPLDDAPTIDALSDITVSLAGGDQNISLSVNDIDGTGVIVTSSDGNASAATTVASGGDTLTITPAAVGSSVVTVRAAKDDNSSVYNEQTFIVTVSEANQAPTASSSYMTLQSGKTNYVTLNASDPEGDALTFNITTAPSNGTAEIINGVLKYTANADYSGSDTVEFTVSDTEPLTSAPATVTITVQPLLLRDTLGSETPLDTAGFNALSALTFPEDTMFYEVDVDWYDGNISISAESFEFNSSTGLLHWYETDENGTDPYHMDVNIAVIEDGAGGELEHIKYLGTATAAQISSDLNITMPSSAEGYRVAWLRVVDELDFWGEAVREWDEDTSSEVTFDSLENFIANGTYVNWGDDGTTLVFANGQTTLDTNGTIVQIINDSQTVVQADAGTWDIINNAATGLEDVLVISPSVDGFYEDGCLRTFKLDTDLNQVVYGELCEAGYGGEVTVYNEVAQAVILNAFKIADPDTFDNAMELDTEVTGANFNGFDGLIAESLVVGVDMYGVDSYIESNGSVNVGTWYNRFDSNGSFTMIDDGETETLSYTDDAGTATIGDGITDFYQLKVLELLDATALNYKFPFATFSGSDTGYKIAYLQLQDELEYWDDADTYSTNGGDNNSSYVSIASFVTDAQFGNNRAFEGRDGFALAFADGSDAVDNSGTLREKDWSDDSVGDAGTWEIIDEVLYTYPDNDEYDEKIFSLDGGSILQKGEFSHANTGGIEYNFNPSAKDNLVQGINDNNISFNFETDLDRDGFIATISPEVVQPMYWYGAYREYNHITVAEVDEFLFDGSGGFTLNFFENGVLSSTESLGYTMDGLTAIIDDNQATPTNIHKLKILGAKNALGIEAMTGIEMPEAARAYEVAHLRLIDEFDFWGEDARDGNGDTFTELATFIETANEANANGFAFSYDGNYALQFASGNTYVDTSSYGTIMEVDIVNGGSTLVGQWKVVQDGSDSVVVFSVSGTNGSYNEYNNAFKDTGNVEIGEYEAAYTGEVSYQFNSAAKEILDAYFQNSRDIRMGFTQAELSGSTYYTVRLNPVLGKFAAKLVFTSDTQRDYYTYNNATVGDYTYDSTASYDVNTQGVLHVDLSATVGIQLYVHVSTRDESKITSQGYNGQSLIDTRWFFTNEQEAIDFYNSLP